jgi:hypothetical protein
MSGVKDSRMEGKLDDMIMNGFGSLQQEKATKQLVVFDSAGLES